MTHYQIYIVRDGCEELDGTWGSEHARFVSLAAAETARDHLRELYPDSEFVIREDT